MVFKVNKFYCIILHKDTLTVSKSTLNHGSIPILWMNNGLYGLISREKIKNAIQYLETQRTLKPPSAYTKCWVFHWDEVITVQPAVGKQLLGE